MTLRGPAQLFLAWAVHDVEEALTFPRECDSLAEATGAESLRLDARQSWLAVGLMAVPIGLASYRGRKTAGRSRWYRATVAGLHAHVGSHLAASVLQRRYTAGLVTALTVMWPAAESARREFRVAGEPLRAKDYVAGAALLLPVALACHVLARLLIRRYPRSSRSFAREEHRIVPKRGCSSAMNRQLDLVSTDLRRLRADPPKLLRSPERRSRARAL